MPHSLELGLSAVLFESPSHRWRSEASSVRGLAPNSEHNCGVGVEGNSTPGPRAPATATHLGLIHADETLVHLGPGGDSTDVPQLVGVLGKGARLHLEERVPSWKGGHREPMTSPQWQGQARIRIYIHTDACTHTHTHTHAHMGTSHSRCLWGTHTYRQRQGPSWPARPTGKT